MSVLPPNAITMDEVDAMRAKMNELAEKLNAKSVAIAHLTDELNAAKATIEMYHNMQAELLFELTETAP